MNNSIHACIWYDHQAQEAAEYYCSVFPDSKILSTNPVVTKFQLDGKVFLALNGGPHCELNPSISFFVTCPTDEEIERINTKLSEGGSALMPLGNYPWSEKYAWVIDKFGLTWQLMKGSFEEYSQKIVPCFLFGGEQFGKAHVAIRHYTSIFPDSEIHELQFYQEYEQQPAGTLKFGTFSLNNDLFTAMDGPGNHNFNFNDGVSIVVECDTQNEIDHYWNQLTEQGTEVQCGWLKDQFGVSWQIIPSILGSLMNDPQKAGKATEAFMKMKKFELDKLIEATS